MKRTHKIIFENLLQEEYNRGYSDCRKAVMQNLPSKPQGGETHRTSTPKGQTRRNLLSLMRASPSPQSIEDWTELLNSTHNSKLSRGAISGALSRMKKQGLVVFNEFGWQASIDEIFHAKGEEKTLNNA